MRSYNYDGAERIKKRNAFSKTNKRPIRQTGPNALEWKLWKVLGPTFTYTGDGAFKIDNLRPDFISKTRRVVVEVYGNYWHKDEPLHKTMRRISRFERNGWRCIIIWEHEIHDPIKLSRKLALI